MVTEPIEKVVANLTPQRCATREQWRPISTTTTDLMGHEVLLLTKNYVLSMASLSSFAC